MMQDQDKSRTAQQLAEEIDKMILAGKEIMTIGHINPDGDCVCSMLAIYHYYQALGKSVSMVLQDKIPVSLHFLSDAEKIISLADYEKQPDVIVLLDCNSLGRAGDEKLLQLAQNAKVLNIDHHAIGNGEEKLEQAARLVDPTAAATGELLYEYFQMIGGWDSLNSHLKRTLAMDLFTSISSDTGMFRFSNTASKTFHYAGDLLSYGVDMEAVRVHLFENKTRKQLVMQGVALDKLRTVLNGKIAYIVLTLADVAAAGATEEDCANLVYNTMLLDGVKIGMIFEEKSDGWTKVSLRSRKGYNVGKIAANLGGGGHVLAAGCRKQMPIERVVKEFLAEAEAEINTISQEN